MPAEWLSDSKQVRHAFLIFTVVLPALLLLVLVDRNGVDVPYADDFTLAPFLAKAAAHDVRFGDLLAQHNEHRSVLPRLLLIAFVRFAHGDLRAQMFFAVFLCALTALNLWVLLCRTVAASAQTRLALLLLINLLLFSPVQAENWTWGFQFPVFLTNWLLTLGILVATSRLHLAGRFLLCALVAIAATFSFGNGFLLWLLTFPLIFIERPKISGRFLWAAVWAILALLSVVFYFIGYTRPEEIASLGMTANPFAYLTYILAFLGGPLSRASRTEPLFQPLIVGITLVAIFSASVYFIARKYNELLTTRSAPWIGLGLYAISSALLAAFARLGFGVSQALDSRYTSFAIYLAIALIAMLAIAHREVPLPTTPRFAAILLAAFVAFSIGAYSWGVVAMRESSETRLRGKGALLFANVIDSAAVYERCLAANAGDARAFANMLDGAGLFHPGLAKTADVSALRNGKMAGDRDGYTDSLRCDDNGCDLKGWASIPQTGRAADCVLLGYTTHTRVTKLFHIAEEIEPRPDVARLLNSAGLNRSGWASHFPRSAVPQDAQEIAAFAVDARRGILYQLPPPRPVQ